MATLQTLHRPHLPVLGRLGWLMGLYAENHRKLERLFAPSHLPVGTHLSRGSDDLLLRVEVVEQHRYTTELCLRYEWRESGGAHDSPQAHIRLYRDARQAEATHFDGGRGWRDVLGPYPPPRELVSHRLRMNVFLGKWLDHLAGSGHGVARLHRLGPNDAIDAAG